MAGAGMCHAGRILHHLRQNLWKPETHVIFVGFQAPGTTGRQLVDGKKFISIFGERIAVKGRIHTMGGFSAHAGQQDLLDWFNAMAPSRPRVFLIHGEARSRRALANQIHTRHSLRAELPELGTAIEL
jgi:metallo-beta-lactamase family protein